MATWWSPFVDGPPSDLGPTASTKIHPCALTPRLHHPPHTRRQPFRPTLFSLISLRPWGLVGTVGTYLLISPLISGWEGRLEPIDATMVVTIETACDSASRPQPPVA